MRTLHHPRQSGFSLVELMVALVLGIILTGGVISVYISSKNSYKSNNGLGQVEEAGRYGLDFMKPIVAMAGYTGCTRPGNSKQGNNYVSSVITGVPAPSTITPLYNFGSPVFGYEATGTSIGDTIPSNGGETATTAPTPPQNASDWSPALNWTDASSNGLYAAIKATALQYSDVLVIHAAGANPALLVGPTYSDASSVYVTPSPPPSSNTSATALDFSPGDFAIASSCDPVSNPMFSFQITSVDATNGKLNYTDSGVSPGNTGTLTLSSHYFGVVTAQTYVFYVGKGADNWPALYEAKFVPSSTGALLTPVELVSGVENMQVLYGVDSSGDQIPDTFETADDVQNCTASGASPCLGDGDWKYVVAVRVALVVQSDNNSMEAAPSAATTYYMLGSGPGSTNSIALTPPLDRRMRRVFVQTFSLRNVLP